jgi:hypothetical protein
MLPPAKAGDEATVSNVKVESILVQAIPSGYYIDPVTGEVKPIRPKPAARTLEPQNSRHGGKVAGGVTHGACERDDRGLTLGQ